MINHIYSFGPVVPVKLIWIKFLDINNGDIRWFSQTKHKLFPYHLLLEKTLCALYCGMDIFLYSLIATYHISYILHSTLFKHHGPWFIAHFHSLLKSSPLSTVGNLFFPHKNGLSHNCVTCLSLPFWWRNPKKKRRKRLHFSIQRLATAKGIFHVKTFTAEADHVKAFFSLFK